MCGKAEVITNHLFVALCYLEAIAKFLRWGREGGERGLLNEPTKAASDFNWCSRGESLDCSRNSKCYFASLRVWNTHDLLSSVLSSRPQVRNNLLPPRTHLRMVPGWCCIRCPPKMRSTRMSASCEASHTTCFPGERNKGWQRSTSCGCKIKNDIFIHPSIQ